MTVGSLRPSVSVILVLVFERFTQDEKHDADPCLDGAAPNHFAFKRHRLPVAGQAVASAIGVIGRFCRLHQDYRPLGIVETGANTSFRSESDLVIEFLHCAAALVRTTFLMRTDRDMLERTRV